MQSEADFQKSYDDAEARWAEIVKRTTGKDFPAKYDPTRPVPSFVLRAGQVQKIDWAPIKPYVPAPPTVTDPITGEITIKPPKEPKLSVPKVPKLVKGVQGVGRAGTKAEQVRDMIRAAMASNLTIESVIARARAELNMGDAQANRYVTENWARVEKANGKK